MQTTRPSAFPLSFEQYCVWQTARVADRWSSGHVDLELQIQGALNVTALSCALQDVFDRHGSLRTTFREEEGRVCQQIPASAPVPLRVHHTSAALIADSSLHDERQRVAEGEALPFRAELFAISSLHHVLLIRTHRIAFDTASQGVLWSDLAVAYSAYSQGQTPQWATPPGEYADFVRWQGQVLGYERHQDASSATTFTRHLKFWRRYLGGAERPWHSSRSQSVPAGAFAEAPVRVPSNLLRVARHCASLGRVTLDMVLRAALVRSIALRTGQTEVILATTTEGLYRSRAAGMIGLFETNLLFRYHEVAGCDFADLLDHVRTQDLEAYKRPHLPAAFIATHVCGCPVEEVVDAALTVHARAPFDCPLRDLMTLVTVRSAPIERFALTIELSEQRDHDGHPSLEGHLIYSAQRLNRAESLAIWDGALAVLEEVADSLTAGECEAASPWTLSPTLHENLYLAPHDPLQHQLTAIWEDVLRRFPVGVWDDFFGLGGTPELAYAMRERVELAVGRELSLPERSQPCTIEVLGEQLITALPRTPSILLRKGDASKPGLFYLHGDFNGGGLYCAELSRYLDACGSFHLLPPHDLNGKPIPGTLEEMAEDHLVTIRQLQPHGPYFLAGHCNGGLIAYELARRLSLAGELVSFVGVIHAQFTQTRVQAEATPLPPLPSLTVPPSGSPLREVKRRQSALRFAQYRQPMWAYHPDTYAGKVTLFWPKQEAFAVSPELAWRDVARETELHLVAGDHLTCITTFVDDLAKQMNQCLRRCTSQRLRTDAQAVDHAPL